MKQKVIDFIVDIPIIGKFGMFVRRCRKCILNYGEANAFIDSYYADKPDTEKKKLKMDMVGNYLFRGISYKQF